MSSRDGKVCFGVKVSAEHGLLISEKDAAPAPAAKGEGEKKEGGE